MDYKGELDAAMGIGGQFEQIMSNKNADASTANKMIKANWVPVNRFNSMAAIITTFKGSISLFVLSKKLEDALNVHIPYFHKNSTKEGMGPIYTVIKGTKSGDKDELIFMVGSMDPAGAYLAAKIKRMPNKLSFMGDPEASSSGVEVVKPKFYKIRAEDIDVLATLANTPIDIKVNSALYALYPSTHLFITENMEMLEKPTILINAIEASKKAKNRSDERAMAGTILTLGPSYSQSEKRATQLHARYKAAVASDSGVAVGLEEFKSFYSKVSYDKDDFPGLTTEAIGHVVALNKEGDFSCDLEVDELLDVSEYKDMFQIDEWTTALLTQARMVYESKAFYHNQICYRLHSCCQEISNQSWRSV